jgi:very-short-patch-repair endonuclease
MAQTTQIGTAGHIVSYNVEFLAHQRGQLVQRLYLIGNRIKAQMQRNLSTSSRGSGPSRPGEYPHSDTGRLRQSIFVRVDQAALTCLVGTNLAYGCVFGGATKVTTLDRGSQGISDVKPGQFVLTQTGEFRKVLATQKYPALEKPDLVEIRVPWRSDHDHTLTLTLDHKVLICRDGLNKWVPAGELLETDCVFVRRKLVHNAGTSKLLVPCIRCGKINPQYQMARKFCSINCRRLHWKETDTNPHTGAIRSEETRGKQGAIVRKRLKDRPDTHPNRVLAKKGRMTQAEQLVADWLTDRGLQFEPQFPIGGLFADFYVASENIIYEADGGYWHQDQQIDIERDKKMLAARPGVGILHLHIHEKKWSPEVLDPNPLPGVHYIRCNPGPDSFADPRFFEPKKIKAIRKFTYGSESPAKQGTWHGWLYDLTVEGVHSFVASGIVIANSWLEYGLPGGKIIRPVNAKVLSWIDNTTGKRVFAKWVRQGPLAPRPWIRKTITEMDADIRRTLFAPFKDFKPAA